MRATTFYQGMGIRTLEPFGQIFHQEYDTQTCGTLPVRHGSVAAWAATKSIEYALVRCCRARLTRLGWGDESRPLEV